MRRARHQKGSLKRKRRQGGREVWIFRWRETKAEGKRVPRKLVVGSVRDLPTERAARAALDDLHLNINLDLSEDACRPRTFADLVEHYRRKELEKADEERRVAFSTKEAYLAYLEKWILPRWGKYQLVHMKNGIAVHVEEWLAGIRRKRGTKAKIRNIMSAVCSHAVRYGWMDINPIQAVRQSAKRERTPQILDIDDLRSLFGQLDIRERTMIMIAALTGLRRGELFAIKWADLDFEQMQIAVTRSIVRNRVGKCKTETSQKPVPMDSTMAEALHSWKRESPSNLPGDWVFASPEQEGRLPYDPQNIMKRHIRPAASRAGITKHIGWHTFRHSFSTLLKANGEDVKTVQELLRHANSRITLDTYTQAVTESKRKAQKKVVEMILPPEKGPAALAAAGVSA